MNGRLMTKNVNALSLQGSLYEIGSIKKLLGILPLDGEVLHATEASFVVLLIESADVHISNPEKFTPFYALSFYLFGPQLLK